MVMAPSVGGIITNGNNAVNDNTEYVINANGEYMSNEDGRYTVSANGEHDINDYHGDHRLASRESFRIKASRDHGRALGKQLVADALRHRVRNVDGDTCEPGEEDTFFVADLGDVYRQHQRWKTNLGRVKPHYAVKCNPDPQVLRLLAELGTGFDCASKAEIEQVLKLGVDPSRIVYAQPCKTKSYIRYAAREGVKQMTFDNADELYKIKKFYPDAELFLRILTDDSASLCRLSLKFGASLDTTHGLLALAKQLELNVTGVAFHVGSGASDPNAFLKAVDDARFVFDQAEALGFALCTLDVGGGFVGDTFEDMADVLSGAIDAHFPPHVRVIGEPGRFYVSSAFTIACNIIARRTVEDEEANIDDDAAGTVARGNKSYMLYLNDGVYGNFSSIMFDHQHPVPQVLRCGASERGPAGRAIAAAAANTYNDGSAYDGSGNGYNVDNDNGYNKKSTIGDEPPRIEYSIWGPTCDGIDCISESCTLAETLDVGDWLFFEDMGAYTKCSATRFNGFTDQHDTLYVTSEPAVAKLLGW